MNDTSAVCRIQDIADRIKNIRDSLPVRVTKKRSSRLIATNALALRLLGTLDQIRKYGRGNDPLFIKAKALKPLARKTFPSWWRCAWLITKCEIFCDDSMDGLMDEIAKRSPSVQQKLQARVVKINDVIKDKARMAQGVTWDNTPQLRKKVLAQYNRATSEWRKYVEKQTRKAALRVWFES